MKQNNEILVKRVVYPQCKVWEGTSKRAIVYSAHTVKNANYIKITCTYKGETKAFVDEVKNIKVQRRDTRGYFGAGGCEYIGRYNAFKKWAKEQFNEKMSSEAWAFVKRIELFKNKPSNDVHLTLNERPTKELPKKIKATPKKEKFITLKLTKTEAEVIARVLGLCQDIKGCFNNDSKITNKIFKAVSK